MSVCNNRKGYHPCHRFSLNQAGQPLSSSSMALLVSTCTLRGDNVRGPRWSTGISRLVGGVFTHHPGLQRSLADALVACQSKAHRVGKEPLDWVAFSLRLPSVARHPAGNMCISRHTIGQIDLYPDLPVHLRRERYAGECAVKENGTSGQDICLPQRKAREDNQSEKPLQAYARSLYWSVIWPSITSRYMNACCLALFLIFLTSRPISYHRAQAQGAGVDRPTKIVQCANTSLCVEQRC